VEKKLEASTANAITLALRLRLELFGQFEVAARLLDCRATSRSCKRL